VINASGLFRELNNGGTSAGGQVSRERIPAPISLFSMLLDFEDMPRLDAAMHKINTDAAFIINAADAATAASYEWAPAGLKKVPPSREGLLFPTNHFVGDWGPAAPDDSFFMTATRMNNLLSLADTRRGAIDVEGMKRVLETPLDKGGDTFYKAGRLGDVSLPYTAYQVIALPGRRTLWLKLAGYRDRAEVNLVDYFR
jgi:hypothetical protein